VTRCLVAVFVLIAASAFAQVRDEWSPEKAVFLEGEPIYLVLRITNTGSSPIGYQSDGILPLFSIEGRDSYSWRNSCDGERFAYFGASFGGHPPTFAPGQTITYKYLLRGYRLEPGEHTIRAKGNLPISVAAPYDSTIEIAVVASPPSALNDVLDGLARVATSNRTREGLLARAGLFAAAPPAFTDRIAALAGTEEKPRNIHYPVHEGYQALADINSVSSRAHLRRLYDATPDLESRHAIVVALGRLSHPDSLEFLASLLPGRPTLYDNRIKLAAANGLVCIGGTAAAAAVVQGTKDWPDRDRRIELLLKIAPRAAVDELVQIDVGADFGVMLSTCARLANLTRYQWCDDDLIASVFSWPPDEKVVRPVFDKIRARWRPWWSRHRNIRLYAPDEPNTNPSPPKIW
jgi:hypothetical protein